MDLTLEKEKIKKEIDLIDNPRIIAAIKKILSDQDDDISMSMVSEPTIEDWEMVTPTGRTPTPAQLDAWLDQIDDKEEKLSGKDALANSLEELKQLRNRKK